MEQDGPRLPGIPERMAEIARRRLESVREIFADAVDAAVALGRIGRDGRRGEKREQIYLPVMQTPLVLQMVGVPARKLYIAAEKINRMLDEHRTLTLEMVKALPIALSDPIAIFRRVSPMGNKEGLAFMLDMADAKGVTLQAAIHLELRRESFYVDRTLDIGVMAGLEEMEQLRDNRRIDKIATAFPAEFGNKWFPRHVSVEDVVFLNQDKLRRWVGETGMRFALCDLTEGDLKARNIKTEKDLFQGWVLYEEWYK